MATHDVADVAAAVAAALADRGGGPWADVRDVRAEVLRQLSLPEDALTSTDVFIALLNAIGVRAPAADVAGATAHHLRALCLASSTPASATASLEELEAALADAGRAREALSPELDLVPVLCGYLLSAEPQLPALALRVLTAASMHGGGCTTLLLQARGLGDSGGLVGALLGRLARSGEDVGILIAALLNNLADTPANQMRLVASGALAALTHVVLDPSASGVIKEHALTAAAAMGGMADEEVSFPQVGWGGERPLQLITTSTFSATHYPPLPLRSSLPTPPSPQLITHPSLSAAHYPPLPLRSSSAGCAARVFPARNGKRCAPWPSLQTGYRFGHSLRPSGTS